MATTNSKKKKVSASRKRTVKKGDPKLKSAKRAKRSRADDARHKRASSQKRRSGQKSRSRAKRASSAWWALPASSLMILILAAISLLAVREYNEYVRFREMRNAVETETFYEGVIVDEYNLSNVSYQDAVKHWENTVEPEYRSRSITLTYNGSSWTKTLAELGYRSNFSQVLKNAWGLGRSGTLEQRYRSINMLAATSQWHNVSRTLFDETLLREWTDEIADSLSSGAVDSIPTGFDHVTKEFTFSKAVSGSTVNKNALYEEAKNLLLNNGGHLEIDVQEVTPAVTEKSFEGQYGQITSAVTNASSSNKNRLNNLVLACEAINGYCVEPGATFSFNEVVGQRTTARGYKKATVYMAGEIAEDIGGGVCQVSTTLWNAAMKANCEIVEWHEHSRPVSYVDRGKDATVSWGSQDMKFKNTSNTPLYLVCYVTENKRVYCDIYGKLFPDGKYITIESKTTQKIQPNDPVYTYNPLLAPGETVTVSEPRTGYRTKTYRVYWNADGTEISRNLLCEGYYKAARGEIEYG